MEANVIKCPNCGASSTNHCNCEYCGSLLVRFVDKGINLSTTSYLTNDNVYDGLIDALKQNLDRQELSDFPVETGIFYKSSPTVKLSRKRHGVATVFRSGSTTWSDGDPINVGDKNRGLVIKFSFDIHAEENDVSDERIERQHQEFKALESFPLFTPHSGIYIRPGSSSRFRSQEYAIDFGQDVEGAARLISEVLSKVYGIPKDAQLIYLSEEDEQEKTEKTEEKEEIETEVGSQLSLLKKISLAIATLFMSFLLLGGIANGWIMTTLFSLCAIAAFVCIYMKKINHSLTWPIILGAFFLAMIFVAMSTDDGSDDVADLQNDALFFELPKEGQIAYKIDSQDLSATALASIDIITLTPQGNRGSATIKGTDKNGNVVELNGSFERNAIYRNGNPVYFVQIKADSESTYPYLQLLVRKDGTMCCLNEKETENVDGVNKLTTEYKDAFDNVFMSQTHGKLKMSNKISARELSNKKEQEKKQEQTLKKNPKDEIRELGFNDGVKFGYSDRGDALREYVQMGTTLEKGLNHIQNVIAKVAYKEDYGDNISDELLDEYCKQFIEGYKSVVLKK